MAVLSISSQVAMGHVGNSASGFALQRLGHEVWAVPTVVLSHHPGHGRPEGHVTPPERVGAIIRSILARGQPRAWFSGYLASAETGHMLADLIEAERARDPDLLYVLDPVLGDSHTGLYVAEEIAAVIRERLLPLADCVLPNRFELTWLTGMAADATETALEAMTALSDRGPGVVALTSAPSDQDKAAVLAAGPTGRYRVEMPAIPDAPHGTGDLFAGLFTAHLLQNRPLGEIIGLATGATHAAIALSRALHRSDLALTEAQGALIDPPVLPEIQAV